MDWKILAALLVAVVIIITGFIGSGIQLPGMDVFGGMGDITGNLLNFNTNVNVTRNIFVYAEIYGDGKINFKDADFMQMRKMSTTDFLIGNEKFTSFSSDIIIMGFTGTSEIKVSEKIISLNGAAHAINIDGTAIFPHPENTIPIKGFITFESATVKNIRTAKESIIKSDAGFLKVNNEDAVLKTESSFFDIGNFAGDIELSDMIKFTGKTDKISGSGKLKIEIG